MFGLWEFLSQDVSFLGGPSSPVLSWVGVFGIVCFFLWQVFKFKKEVSSIRQGFDRICPKLVKLVQDRGDIESERFIQRQEKSARSLAGRGSDSMQRSDREDLKKIDIEMNKEPLFQEPWAQYRMTLILEQVPWFMEPRLFSTQRAEQVLTQEVLMGSRINLSWYQQIPSLVTGLGLLLTFLALFIGLGKLHAEGNEILGIQGLINGLSGKFLTSIVGLMTAYLFTLIEKSTVARLMRSYKTFLVLVDQLFPRKTMEQILEQLSSFDKQQQAHHVMSGETFPSTGGGWGMRELTGPLANLTSSIQTLTQLQERLHSETRRTLGRLPDVLRDEMQSSRDELTEAFRDLMKMLKDTSSQYSGEELSHSRPFLWKALPDPPNALVEESSGKTKSWPRWPRISRSRRAG